MPSNLLFKRKIIVTIDTLRITDLDMVFSIKKNLKSEPNTCDLKVYNLNNDHISAIEQKKTATVQVEAGYESATSVLFIGDLRTSLSVREGPDRVTALSSGDGEKALRTKRVNTTIRKGAKTADVLKTVAKSLGVGDGNLSQAVFLLQSMGVADVFRSGTVLSGSAAREMTAICKTAGFSWSIQDGKLQILALKQSLAGTAINVNQDSGLIGSPTVDNKGILSCKILLTPDVFPGRKMVIKSDRLQGQYRIEECAYSGSTFEGDWYIDIKCKRY